MFATVSGQTKHPGYCCDITRNSSSSKRWWTKHSFICMEFSVKISWTKRVVRSTMVLSFVRLRCENTSVTLVIPVCWIGVFLYFAFSRSVVRWKSDMLSGYSISIMCNEQMWLINSTFGKLEMPIVLEEFWIIEEISQFLWEVPSLNLQQRIFLISSSFRYLKEMKSWSAQIIWDDVWQDQYNWDCCWSLWVVFYV